MITCAGVYVDLAMSSHVRLSRRTNTLSPDIEMITGKS